MKKVFIVFAIFMVFTTSCKFKGAEKQTEAVQLAGAWKLVKSNVLSDFSENNVFNALKIFGDGYFSVSIYNKKTGKLLTCNAGTYTVSGNSYKENIIFSNIPAMVHTKSNLSIKFKGNRIYLEGDIRNGKAKIVEIWERVEE